MADVFAYTVLLIAQRFEKAELSSASSSCKISMLCVGQCWVVVQAYAPQNSITRTLTLTMSGRRKGVC